MSTRGGRGSDPFPIGLPATRFSDGTPRARVTVMDKGDKLENERAKEQTQGLTDKRRGSPAAASDKPEGTPPHPQDVNEISE